MCDNGKTIYMWRDANTSHTLVTEGDLTEVGMSLSDLEGKTKPTPDGRLAITDAAAQLLYLQHCLAISGSVTVESVFFDVAGEDEVKDGF